MKFFTGCLGFIMAAALFCVTVTCTVDLLSQVMPAKFWYLPVLSTAAFDVGIIVWLLTLLHEVENTYQRVIAWVSLGIDFLGVAITTLGDMFFYDSTKGLVAALSADTIRGIIVALMAIILANVAAWGAMHLLSPKYIAASTGRGAIETRTVTVQAEKPKLLPLEPKPAPKLLPPPTPKPMPVPQPNDAALREIESQRRIIKDLQRRLQNAVLPVSFAQTATIAGQFLSDDEISVVAEKPQQGSEEQPEIAANPENVEEQEEAQEFEKAVEETQEAVPTRVPFGRRLANATKVLSGKA